MNEPNYYAVIPATVRYDAELPANAKLLYGEITALSNKTGECWATNGYFAELYGVAKETVSRWVSALQDRGHVFVRLKHDENGAVTKRSIGLTKRSRGIDEKIKGGIDEKIKGNNTRGNTTSNKKKEKYIKRKPTLKKRSSKSNKEPSPEEWTKEMVQEYAKSIGFPEIDAEYFLEYYQATDWKRPEVNKKIKSVKRCIVTWKRNHTKYNPTSSPLLDSSPSSEPTKPKDKLLVTWTKRFTNLFEKITGVEASPSEQRIIEGLVQDLDGFWHEMPDFMHRSEIALNRKQWMVEFEDYLKDYYPHFEGMPAKSLRRGGKIWNRYIAKRQDGLQQNLLTGKPVYL